MNGFNFTERVRRILAMAREEAARLHHEYVGPEHMLLGIVREGQGVGTAVLLNFAVDLGALAEALVSAAPAAPEPGVRVGPDLPYTYRAKKSLEFAMAEAQELRHAYVGSEHLLLGLLREETGIAARALNSVGVTLQTARTEMLRLLGHTQRTADPATRPATPSITPPSRITDQLREQVAWTRLTRALDVSQRLGTPPALTLEADGTLTVPLGPDLVVSVEFPPGVRLRRRPADAGSPNDAASAQEVE